MEVKSRVNIHNRFIIEVRDKTTNELKQTGIAENIILNRCWTQICNFNSYFNYVHFGQGTGVLSASRTTLFDSLGYKSTTLVEGVNAYPVTKITKKITINPEEQIGKTIREVGISETTNAINTHALITDAEGNPLSIPKTDLDVVEIYATVFVTFQHPNEENFRFINFPNNAIAKYFIDHTNPSNSITAQMDKLYNNGASNGTSVLKSNTGTRTVDANNQKVSIVTRFGISEANGEIRGVGLLNTLKVNYPAVGVFEGHNFENIVIGTGDGSKIKFEIPFSDAKNIEVKINDIINTDFEIKRIEKVNYKLQELSEVGSGNSAISITPDGKIIITASNNAPYFTVQKLNENTGLYEKIQELSGVGNTGRGAAMTPDGKIIITASNNAPYFTVQKLNENTGLYEKIQELSGVGNTGTCVSVISNKKIITASGSSPYYTVQELNEGNGLYEKVQELSGVGAGYKVMSAFNGKTVILSLWAMAPYFIIQRLNENTGLYEKVQELSGVGNGASGAYISPDEKNIITHNYNNTPYFTVQKLNENTGLYEKIQELSEVGNDGRGAAMTPDGKIIITASNNAPYFTVQKLNENTGLYEKIQELSGVGNDGRGAAMTPDGKTIITASNNAPYFTVQKMLYPKVQIVFDTPPASGAVITASYNVDYAPKTTDFVHDVKFTIQFGEGA